MSSRNRRDHRTVLGVGALLGLFGAVLHFAGCGLSTEGTLDQTGVPCNTAQDCDDKNACTDDQCSDQKFCSNTAKTGGGPDDANDCTTDACANGLESHTKEADGTSCKAGVGTGICGMGMCIVKCTDDAVCDDKNACTTDSCDLGSKTCSHGNLNGPEPGVAPVQGDCKTALCVAGVPQIVNDDTDVPPKPACKTPVCSKGTLTVTNDAAQTSCGPKLECDGKGVCTGCVMDSECTAPNTCQTPACTSGSCTTKNVAAGTAPPDQQKPNDCQKVVCDGNGTPMSQEDDTDKPMDDGNPCTNDTCIAGSPQHAPLVGMMCMANGGQICDANGQCVQCTGDANCDDNSKCTTDTCVNEKCAHAMISCSDANGCTDDTCDPASGCKHANNTSACDDGNACTTGDMCSGGACMGAALNCSSPPTCKKVGNPACNGGVCNYVNDNAASCSDGNACTTNDICSGGSCQGGAAPNCNDVNACTVDGCDMATGCTHMYIGDGMGCGASACLGGMLTAKVCGGGNCNASVSSCPAGHMCASLTACETCSDSIKNGDESDVDCGGHCPNCPNGKTCNGKSDCQSNNCMGGICAM